MAGHSVAPFEVYATRKSAKKDKEARLLLANLGDDSKIDLLDAIENHALLIPAITSTDHTRSVSFAHVERGDDRVYIVFQSEISGEQEIILNADDDSGARKVVFTKGRQHFARYFACAVIRRASTAREGTMLLHSPWGRGGNKSQVSRLLQNALNAAKTKSKIHLKPQVPQAALERIVRDMNATKVTYTRSTGITSKFASSRTDASSPAELALVVKGTETLPFRDALSKALQSKQNKSALFTVRVADAGNPAKYHEETFDDVEVTVTLPGGGTRQYSLRDETVPTIGFNLTPEINEVYWGLPRDTPEKWPKELMDGSKKHLDKLLAELG